MVGTGVVEGHLRDGRGVADGAPGRNNGPDGRVVIDGGGGEVDGRLGVNPPVAEFLGPGAVRLGIDAGISVSAHLVGGAFEDEARLVFRQSGVDREDEGHDAGGIRTGAGSSVEIGKVIAAAVAGRTGDIGGVDIHAGGGDVGPGAVVRPPPVFPVAGRGAFALVTHAHGDHRDGGLVASRVVNGAVTVAGGEEDGRTEAVASVGDRPVDGAVDGRGGAAAAPGVTEHIGFARLPGPIDGVGNDGVTGHPAAHRVAVGNTHGDDLAAIGYTGQTDAVVAGSRHNAGAGRAVRVVAGGTARAAQPSGVVARQEIIDQVGMVEVHAFVQNGHLDGRGTGSGRPGAEDFHIGTGRPAPVAGVDPIVVEGPLVVDEGVVGAHRLHEAQEVGLGIIEQAGFV